MIGRAAPQHDVLRWLPHFDVYRHSPIADRLDLARPGMADEGQDSARHCRARWYRAAWQRCSRSKERLPREADAWQPLLKNIE